MEKTYDTVSMDESGKAVVIIDQTLLPGETKLVRIDSAEDMWEAIYRLKVRGAPAIGVFAAFGMYVLSQEIAEQAKNKEAFYREFTKQKDYLNSARPTAVNLSWALKRMDLACKSALRGNDEENAEYKENGSADLQIVLDALRDEAFAIQKEDIETCKKIGEYGLTLLKPGAGILTHCNAGRLATNRYGTATAPIYLGHEKGYGFRVFADETRPLLQGARLTSYELAEAGIDVTLLCDNMAASLMKSGKIDAVFVGCDRVAANGDAANKIGTLGVAILAKQYQIPFYVCAPTSTIDMETATGADIVIEQRKPEEVTEMWYEKRMAPEGIKVFNPAFDVTDHELITAIITEKGIMRAPYDSSFAKIMQMQ